MFNKHLLTSKRFWLLTACLICAMGVLLVIQSPSVVAGDKAKAKNMDRMKAYQVYQAKCTGCHDSVANPELPGRTRDDWHLVVNVMHGYGLGLSTEDSEMIIDLLYQLRKGLEREAG
ncbi:MAG: cytochrome c [Desulfobacterales bacterium]